MSPTAREVADDIIGGLPFLADPAFVVRSLVTRAAQAHADGRREHARALTHAACLLVEAAGSPNVVRGAVLTRLVDVYGEPKENE